MPQYLIQLYIKAILCNNNIPQKYKVLITENIYKQIYRLVDKLCERQQAIQILASKNKIQ